MLHLIWGKKARINKIKHQLSRIITLNMWTQVQASEAELRSKIGFIAELIKIQHKAEQSKV